MPVNGSFAPEAAACKVRLNADAIRRPFVESMYQETVHKTIA
jgi:hypothetical protein